MEVPAGWTITLRVNFDYAAASIAHFTIIERYRACNGDLRAIDAMLAKLKLAWDEEKLTELRQEERWLVERERHAIRVVANALMRHRRLSAFDVKWLKACTPPAPQIASV